MPTMSTKPTPDVTLDVAGECYDDTCWKMVPDNILLHIFSFLDTASLSQAGLVCKSWLRVAFDEFLWKDLFYRHWRINRSISMAPGKYSWVAEYKRLLYHTPAVESEVLKQHADQVLHVSFSHNGKMFATCSKDGFIRVWDAAYPTSLKYKSDMRKFTWKYTQFSQFNSSDTLLLVSGVHFGSLSTSGEIAVFSLEGEFVMQCRVMNKPYDVFGTWYNDFYLLSGNLHWTGHLNSCSAIWLNKAYQETSSEEESVVMRLFKFANVNASSMRTIMTADCLNQHQDVAIVHDTGQAQPLTQQELSSNLEAGYILDEENEEVEEKKEEQDIQQQEPKVVPKKKASRNVQSIQVYENGSFITKFLEVDTDEPSNGLNGTIKYSSDYRLAEGPNTKTDPLQPCDSSGSELSETVVGSNLSSSEMSERSFTSSQEMVENACCSMEVDTGKEDKAMGRGSLSPVEFNLSVPSSMEVPLSDTDSDIVHIDSHSDDRNSADLDLSCEISENGSLTIDLEKAVSNKRILHGQQQEQGEIVRAASTTEPDHQNLPTHSLASLYSGGDQAVADRADFENSSKLSFCCVDYKKPRRGPGGTAGDQRDTGSSRPCAQARICSSSQSEEQLEFQSLSDVNVECIPVTPKCNTLSEIQKDMKSQNDTRNKDPLLKMPLLKNKTKRKKSKLLGDKYLIFTKGSQTYTPHQIGIKRIKPLSAFNADGSRLLPNVSDNTHNLERADEYDEVDHLIDMHGHIIGMALSPDQRYLYVNSRPWPKNYFIENALYPPPIAQEIDIHVIDLLGMREVGTMHRAHKAYTSNDECFFIFLDVCEEYVASGAEDKHGYLWDRHYGLCLHKYPHTDVVNSVAFNPSDPEVLVTVSDDFSIKIWRSRSREKEVVQAFNREHCIRLKHVQAIMEEGEELTDPPAPDTPLDIGNPVHT